MPHTTQPAVYDYVGDTTSGKQSTTTQDTIAIQDNIAYCGGMSIQTNVAYGITHNMTYSSVINNVAYGVISNDTITECTNTNTDTEDHDYI